MCGILDDVLPVLGAVAGSFIPGLGTALGATLGGALGGGLSEGFQTHWNPEATLLGAATGGAGGYFGGGSLGTALENLGTSAVGPASEGFATDLASNVAPTTLGGLESATGGASLFGPMAGTGTAIGGAADALGGGGLGVAGGGALSGVTDNLSYLGGLGGGTQGTGLNIGGPAGSTADLSGITSGTTPATGQYAQAATPSSPTSILGSSGNTANGVTTTPTTSPLGSNVMEGSQAASAGATTGSPMAASGGGVSLEGGQAAVAPGGDQGALAAMYGPTSTAPGSAIGQGIANTGVEVPGANGVQFGALGEGTSAAPGSFGGNVATDIPGQSIGANYGTAANSADQGGGWQNVLSQLFSGGQGGGAGYNFTPGENGGFQVSQIGQLNPLLGLAKSGLGAYQQYAQQQANNAYRNSISNIFSPTGPYAQQMQSNIARQYAAKGMNAEKGPQAVQLAAALAQAQAQALGGANYAHAATATPGASMLNSLFSTAVNPQYAPGLAQLGSSAWNGLQNLFS